MPPWIGAAVDWCCYGLAPAWPWIASASVGSVCFSYRWIHGLVLAWIGAAMVGRRCDHGLVQLRVDPWIRAAVEWCWYRLVLVVPTDWRNYGRMLPVRPWIGAVADGLWTGAAVGWWLPWPGAWVAMDWCIFGWIHGLVLLWISAAMDWCWRHALAQLRMDASVD